MRTGRPSWARSGSGRVRPSVRMGRSGIGPSVPTTDLASRARATSRNGRTRRPSASSSRQSCSTRRDPAASSSATAAAHAARSASTPTAMWRCALPSTSRSSPHTLTPRTPRTQLHCPTPAPLHPLAPARTLSTPSYPLPPPHAPSSLRTPPCALYCVNRCADCLRAVMPTIASRPSASATRSSLAAASGPKPRRARTRCGRQPTPALALSLALALALVLVLALVLARRPSPSP